MNRTRNRGNRAEGRSRGRLLVAVYLAAIGHVAILFTVGEPYPSLQGPLFSGHWQEGRTIHVPFYSFTGDAPAIPSRETLLRHESLALPVQRDFASLVPSEPGRLAREFLIGHSLRVSEPGPAPDPKPYPVIWSTLKFHAPLNGPPQLLGEEDLIDDD